MTASGLLQELTEFGEYAEESYLLAVTTQGVDEAPEALAYLLDAVRQCRAELATLYSTIEVALLATMTEKRIVVDGIGEVEALRKTKRTAWRHDEMVPAVIARVMDEPQTLYDPETGDLLPYAVIGQRVAERLRDCVGFGAGKVTGLRAIGLQPDEFCTEEADGYSIKMPKREVTP